MLRFFTILIFIVLSSFGAKAERFSAAISFTEVQNQIFPYRKKFRQSRNIRIVLFDDHRVKEWSARRADRPDQRSLSYETVLGALTNMQWVKVKWLFQDNNTLVRETIFPSHVETMKIHFRAGQCSVVLSYDLKPGFETFEMWDIDSNKPTRFEYVGATQAQCTVDEELTS